jgi:hypothetical protein
MRPTGSIERAVAIVVERPDAPEGSAADKAVEIVTAMEAFSRAGHRVVLVGAEEVVVMAKDTRGRRRRQREAPVMTEAPSTESQACPTCAMIPISHLNLDLDEPVGGWEATLAERGVEVDVDDLGRPSVPRAAVAAIIEEQRARGRGGSSSAGAGRATRSRRRSRSRGSHGVRVDGRRRRRRLAARGVQRRPRLAYARVHGRAVPRGRRGRRARASGGQAPRAGSPSARGEAEVSTDMSVYVNVIRLIDSRTREVEVLGPMPPGNRRPELLAQPAISSAAYMVGPRKVGSCIGLSDRAARFLLEHSPLGDQVLAALERYDYAPARLVRPYTSKGFLVELK